jgi:outer membrane cobalamin receptor
MRVFLFFLPVLLFCKTLCAQRVVYGHVKDSRGKALANVTVRVVEQNNQTLTDSSGAYLITTQEEFSTLKFSKEGFIDVTAKVSKVPLDIQLNMVTDLFSMSLEQMLNIEVVSVSRTSERLAQTPANVLVITRQEIEQRGYTDLKEVFQDIPGIDIALGYGDYYQMEYWRGYRTTSASPYLLMVDGMVRNHLFWGHTSIKPAIPLSNIERIEIVYGPASSVYGPNAFMGILNIITNKKRENDGIEVYSKLQVGNLNLQTVDFSTLFKKEDFRAALTAFLNHGNIDTRTIENYEWTKSKYLKDTSLWGNYLKNPDMAGSSDQIRNHRGVALNFFYKNAEIGINQYTQDGTNGIHYATDRLQGQSSWIQNDLSVFFKNLIDISDNCSFTTKLSYRANNLIPGSCSIEGLGDYGQKRTVTHGVWELKNSQYAFNASLNYSYRENLTFNLGWDYQNKNIQKNYDLQYNRAVVPDSVDLEDMPVLKGISDLSYNRTRWGEYGIFFLSKYKLSQHLGFKGDHSLNIGIRYDDHSYYGNNINLRLGYIGSIGKFAFKLLYGESFIEPAPRNIYAYWGSIIVPQNTLLPERSKNIESEFLFTNSNYSISANPFYCLVSDVTTQISNQLQNIGRLKSYGVDISVQKQFHVPYLNNLRLWGMYSFLDTRQEFPQEDGSVVHDVAGDMAKHKLFFGTTLCYKTIDVTIKGRFIGTRKNFYTNPVRKTPSYTTLDLVINYNDFLFKGLNIRLKIQNLLDEQYFHPGIKNASAGTEPGYWVGNRWYGSKGVYTSLIPQNGANYAISLIYNLR